MQILWYAARPTTQLFIYNFKGLKMLYTQYIKAENANGEIELPIFKCHAINELDAYHKMRHFCDDRQLYIMDYDTEISSSYE